MSQDFGRTSHVSLVRMEASNRRDRQTTYSRLGDLTGNCILIIASMGEGSWEGCGVTYSTRGAEEVLTEETPQMGIEG